MNNSKIQYFVEDKVYSISDLEACILADDVSDLRKESHLEKQPNGHYRFRFVGVIAFKSYVVCVLPKVYSGDQNLSAPFPNIVKTLKKYARVHAQEFEGFDFLNTDVNDPNCSALPIADFVLSDYLQHGVYRQDVSFSELGTGSVTDWPETVAVTEPYFSAKSPIYFETINNLTDLDRNNVVTEVHKWAVNYFRDRFGGILGYDSIAIYDDVVEELEQISDQGTIVSIIRRTLNETFTDREGLLLKSLLALLENSVLAEFTTFSVFGTRNYEYVWEAVCKDYFRHEVEVGSNASDIIDVPTWQLFGAGIKGKTTIIPDILHHHKSSGTLFLFDAKYYNLAIDLKRPQLSGEPNIKDIFKQFLYEQILNGKIGTIVANAFLFPVSEERLKEYVATGTSIFRPYTVAGHVEYVLFASKYISVILMPISRFSEKYYNEIKITDTEFHQLSTDLTSRPL